MSKPTQHGSGRGWLEGTLDVISGSTSLGRPSSRPSTPVNNNRGVYSLQRIPSQESLDRSIHNDSGHGSKSTVEIIRDLKQSNARLTARTAELEADFMNQLNQTTRQMEQERQQTAELLAQKEKQLVQLETRCTNMEGRVREKDEQLVKLKEESAFQRHTISNLKTQMDDNDDSPPENKRLLEQTQDALHRTEVALAELQNEHKRLKAQHDDAAAWKEHPVSSNQDGEFSSSLQTQLDDRELTIEELRAQVLDYSGKLTDLTSELSKIKASAESKDQYRREEADDLRILNDAQEEEIETLRKQLEEAIQEIELREQELDEKNRLLQDASIVNKSVVGDDQAVTRLEAQLKEAQDENQGLKRQLEQTQGATAQCVADLQDKVDELEAASASVLSQPAKVESDSVKLRRALEEAERDAQLLEDEHRRKVSKMQHEQQMLESEYNSKLQSKEMEIRKLKRSSAGEPTHDSARVASLEAELIQLRRSSGATRSMNQSGGSVEEDLRKELKSLQVAREKLQSELSTLKHTTEEEMDELKSKLEDRDTTISALVKSSVAFEDQVEASSMQLELDTSIRSQLDPKNGRGGDDAGFDVVLAPNKTSYKKEVVELRRLLANQKKAEEELRTEIFRLKNQAYQAKQDAIRLRTQVDDARGLENARDVVASSGDVTVTIQERDQAISRLVKQSVAQDKLIAQLRQDLGRASEELISKTQAGDGSPTWEEVDQLREEAEVFAGQVIELSEEIESLKQEVETRDKQIDALEEKIKSEVETREKRVESLEQELKELRDFAGKRENKLKLMDLEAEIDELREANDTQLNEIRLLRRKTREFETFPDDIAKVQNDLSAARKEVEGYKQVADEAANGKGNLAKQLEEEEKSHAEAVRSLEEQLESAVKAKDELEDKIQGLEKSGGSPSRVSDVDELEIEALRAEIATLQGNLTSQNAAVDSAKETIRELEGALADRRSAEAGAHEAEKEELLSDIDSLTRQLEEARAQLKKVEDERGIIEDFKAKLESADEAREVSEKSIVDNYERKLSLLKLDKDVTIDKLRKELHEEKEINEERLEEATVEVQQYEMQLKDLQEEMAAQLEQRETRIFALEHTLEAQEQLVKNMRIEMDHLQGSMETAAAARRKEIDEMQAEATDLTSMNAKQEREIKDLKIQLHEKEEEHKEELGWLQQRIASLEDESSADLRNATDLKMELRVQEVKDRLEKLKWRNTSLKEENEALRERLIKAEERSEKGERGKEEIAAQLKEEIDGKEAKIKELESKLDTQEASTTKNATPRRGTRGPTPQRSSRGPTPQRSSRGPTPQRGSRGPTPKRDSRGPTPTRSVKEVKSSPRRLGGLLGRRRANSTSNVPEEPTNA